MKISDLKVNQRLKRAGVDFRLPEIEVTWLKILRNLGQKADNAVDLRPLCHWNCETTQYSECFASDWVQHNANLINTNIHEVKPREHYSSRAVLRACHNLQPRTPIDYVIVGWALICASGTLQVSLRSWIFIAVLLWALPLSPQYSSADRK